MDEIKLSPVQIKLIQETFRSLLPVSEVAAELFYRRLFDLDPSLRFMFKIAIKEQERKLLDMLHIAVFSLDRPEQLIPALERLGERHLQYGVTSEQYETVGLALNWMLEQGLEERYTPEFKVAWENLYTLIAQIMRTSAEKVQAQKQDFPSKSC